MEVFSDVGVNDGVEFLKFFGIGKDCFGEIRAVETVGGEGPGAKFGGYLTSDIGV